MEMPRADAHEQDTCQSSGPEGLAALTGVCTSLCPAVIGWHLWNGSTCSLKWLIHVESAPGN